MLKLFVSYAEEAKGEWANLGSYEYKHAEPFPEDTLSVSEPIELPNGERFTVSGAYSTHNRGINIELRADGVPLISVFGFRGSIEHAYDPTFIFLTPKGTHLQIMNGPEPIIPESLKKRLKEKGYEEGKPQPMRPRKA